MKIILHKYKIISDWFLIRRLGTFSIILSIFLFSSGYVFSQKRSFRFQYLNADQGLSQNFVDCILKDSFGFMWFGTRNGLNRFDGYRFTVFINDIKNKNSISNNLVRSLCEDKYGNIWIGTDKGLNIYLYEKDRFISFSTDSSYIPVLAAGKINCIISDHIGDIWIGTDKGLIILNEIMPNGKFSKYSYFSYSAKKESVSDDLINFIYEDKEHRMWIGTNQGLDLFQEQKGVIKKFKYDQNDITTLSNNEILSIFQDETNLLWVGTSIGLNRLDPESGQCERYYHTPSTSSLAHNNVKCITRDITGHLIFGTLGGLSIYNFESNIFYNYTHEINSNQGINNNFINSILADSEGNIWIGTERGGINRYNIYQNEFEYYEYIPGDYQSLSHNTVNSVMEDNNNLWIGTAGGGLNKIHKVSGNYTHYKNNPQEPTSINNDFITSINRDGKGNIWIGTWGNGINRLSSKNISKGLFDHFVQIPGNQNSLINDYVSSITNDKTGNLWIGTFGGLNKYDPVKQLFTHIGSNLPEDLITKVGCLSFDIKGNLWVGTEQGLFKISGCDSSNIISEKYIIKKFTKSSIINGSISGDYVISICEDSKGSMWFGTYGDGLNKLITDTVSGKESFLSFTENDGLSNNIIYGIQEDIAGNLWLSTDHGLSRFSPESLEFRNYYTTDGLQSNQFYWSAHYTNIDGIMYFGNMKGMIAINPEKIISRELVDNLVITNFQIFNEPVEIGKEYYDEQLLNTSIAKFDNISLPYKVKEFSFEFAALDFDQTEKIHYRYKLKGFDNEWNYVGPERRFVSYTNLKGGDYTFIVEASLDNIKWGNPREIKIHIIPPFWARWWFLILIILISLSSVIGYNRYRIYALKQRKKILEFQVKERTIQIEGQKQQLELQNLEIAEQRDKLMDLNKKVQHANQEQMRFFTHMSHEFRTPLTLIISPIEQVISKIDEKTDTFQKLLIAKKSANRLLHLVNQLMEIRRIKTGNIELNASKIDMVKFLENISQSFSNLANQRNIKYDFISKQNSIITYTDKEKLEIIFYNVVSNAIKYTPEGGNISINISVVNQYPEKSIFDDEILIVKQKSELKGKLIELIIRDTGIGIEKEYLKEIFRRFYRISVESHQNILGTGIGLYLTKELVKALHGWLIVRSSPGKGSEFKFLFPFGKDYLSESEILETEADNPAASEKLHLTMLTDQIETRKKSLLTFSDPLKSEQYKPLVLLVDDDSELLDYVSEFISKDFKIIVAKNGAEGLEKAKLFLPDVVISDNMMPKMDGIEFCSLLKSDIQTSHIPFVLLSARTEVEGIVEGLESGADDYLQKPFDLIILDAKIKSIIENRLRLKKLFSSSLVPDLKKITSSSIDNKFLKQAVEIIEKSMVNSEFGVQDLASALFVSRSLLHKKLTSIVGQSAYDFIISLRLKRSAQLILEGSLKISEIAYQVGFNDPKYFSRCFKKHFGKAPSEYLHEVK